MEGLGPKLLRFFVVLSVINLGVASLIWIFHPDLQRSLIKNGYFVQNATAIFFLAGFFLGAIPLIASPDPARRRLYFWIPLLSLFAWLEEIRYGMGYIHFHTLVLEGKKVDAIHDLLNVLQFSLHGIPFHRLIEAAGLVALSLPAFHYRLPNRILDLARADLPYRFFFIAFALGMVGQVLDLKLFPGRYVHLIEEVLEMNGSIAMALAAALIGVPASWPRCTRPSSWSSSCSRRWATPGRPSRRRPPGPPSRPPGVSS